MLSDITLSVAGHTFSLSNSQLLIVAAVLLVGAGIMLAFSKNRRVVVKRSVATDELYAQLGRIAEALERLSNQLIERIIPQPSQKIETPAPANRSGEGHTVAYSMFGR
jgi:hypothetical protein